MAKKPFTPEERQAYLEAKQKQREELETKVKDLVSSFRDSDTFKNYLSQMSDFNRRCGKYLHHYSPRNLLFIVMQDPNAQIVGAASAWRKTGRFIKKGEHSHIMVWAPMKEAVMQKKLNENGEPILKPDGTPELEPERDENGRVKYRFSGRFKLEPVFDISQTDGEPLPELAQELKNPVEHFADYENAIRDASPMPIYYSNEPEAAALSLRSAKGACSFSKNMIVVKHGMSQEHTLKTMIHEVTHAKLHSPGKIKAALKDNDKGMSKHEIEVQAECTAFVVCSHFGLDTSDYSIPYIASWSEDEKMTSFSKSLDTIIKTSDEIIDQMETHLWIDMGIDQTLQNIAPEQKAAFQMPPAVLDPSQKPDLSHALADKTVSAFRDMGFRLRYEKPLLAGEPSSISLQKETRDGTVRISAKLFFDKDGCAVPDFERPDATVLSLRGKDSNILYFNGSGESLSGQLNNMERYVNARSQAADRAAPTAKAQDASNPPIADPVAYVKQKRSRERTLAEQPGGLGMPTNKKSNPKRSHSFER